MVLDNFLKLTDNIKKIGKDLKHYWNLDGQRLSGQRGFIVKQI